MGIELKRSIYEKLLAWKCQDRHATLELSGARQVGKTYIANKFADEQYGQKVYINLLEFSGELFLESYQELKTAIKNGQQVDNPIYELIKKYHPDFIDSKDTIVIIDEIQESPDIYNRIREFTRELQSDFIVTGSYLGRVLSKEFKYSSGDMVSMQVNTLSFEEFLTATEKMNLYEDLNLFGADDSHLKELEKEYDVYCKIGGYPAVVLRYLEGGTLEECQSELLKIIRLFSNESKRYFEDILDVNVYDNIFCSIARILLKEKKGFDEDSFSEELRKVVSKDYSSNLSKASVNRAIDWLYSAGIIGFAGKVVDCNPLEFKAKSRCYFLDVGLAYYFLDKTGTKDSNILGIINENFVYLDLRRRIEHPSTIAFEMPAFATLGNGELDFFVISLIDRKVYGVEVKAGKNSGKTANMLLAKGKVNYVVFAKGNTKGGINQKVITIPIYGIGKFGFDEMSL